MSILLVVKAGLGMSGGPSQEDCPQSHCSRLANHAEQSCGAQLFASKGAGLLSGCDSGP